MLPIIYFLAGVVPCFWRIRNVKRDVSDIQPNASGKNHNRLACGNGVNRQFLAGRPVFKKTCVEPTILVIKVVIHCHFKYLTSRHSYRASQSIFY